MWKKLHFFFMSQCYHSILFSLKIRWNSFRILKEKYSHVFIGFECILVSCQLLEVMNFLTVDFLYWSNFLNSFFLVSNSNYQIISIYPYSFYSFLFFSSHNSKFVREYGTLFKPNLKHLSITMDTKYPLFVCL